jgi:hypothetical protein
MRILVLILALAGGLAAQTTINGSRVITGAWDASGATSTKASKVVTSLPASCGAGETVFKSNATGGFQLYACKSTDTWGPVAGLGTKSLTLFDPVTGDSGRVQLQFPSAITIVRVSCSVKAATSVSINLDERAEATPDTAGTAVLGSALVCDADSANTTSFSNAGIAARVPLALTISAVSGTPDTLRVFIEYTVD